MDARWQTIKWHKSRMTRGEISKTTRHNDNPNPNQIIERILCIWYIDYLPPSCEFLPPVLMDRILMSRTTDCYLCRIGFSIFPLCFRSPYVPLRPYSFDAPVTNRGVLVVLQSCDVFEVVSIVLARRKTNDQPKYKIRVSISKILRTSVFIIEVIFFFLSRVNIALNDFIKWRKAIPIMLYMLTI